MATLIYSRFFWQDWQNDAELKLCDLGAQGMWVRLLAIAADENDRGRVTIGGRIPTPDDLVRLFGCKESPEQIAAWQDQLIANHVCDVDDDSAMVSRRLRSKGAASALSASEQRRIAGQARAASAVRDERGRMTKPAGDPLVPAGDPLVQRPLVPAGHSAGPADAQRTETPNRGISKEIVQRHQRTDSRARSHSHGQNPESNGHGQRSVEAMSTILGDLLQVWPGDNRRERWPGQLAKVLVGGVDFDLDLVPVVREMAEGGRLPPRITSLNFFANAARQRWAERTGAVIATPSAVAEAKEFDIPTWAKALNLWVLKGAWDASVMGPRPDRSGYIGPKDMGSVALAKWNEQGGHPAMEYDLAISGFVDWGQAKRPLPDLPSSAPN